ncbi:O-antigen ligase family protein [Aquimarina sp. SS2-1]|uniref:O-antigen ligase family protein n=1 Tax=Aquimarina besae TaxID=3342247 RepID=UPI00366B2F1E
MINSYLLACFLCVIYIHYNFYDLGLYLNLRDAKFYDLPFRDAILNFEYESLHPTYVSLWFAFGIILLLDGLKKIELNARSVLILSLRVGLIILLVATIIILSSRVGILALFLSVMIYIYRLKNKSIKWALVVFFIGISVISITKISYISSRFIDEIKYTEFKPPVGLNHNSTNIRIGIYKCSLKIIKENVVFGVGIGDTQNELDYCFSDFDTNAYEIRTYNSHNYFFHSMLVTGIFGLLALLTMILFFIMKGLEYNCYPYICLVLIIVIGLFFENIFSRNVGIIFFTFFNTLFLEYFETKRHAYSLNSSI